MAVWSYSQSEINSAFARNFLLARIYAAGDAHSMDGGGTFTVTMEIVNILIHEPMN